MGLEVVGLPGIEINPGQGSFGFTPGAVIIADSSGSLNEAPDRLFWDDSRLHIGTRDALPQTATLNVYPATGESPLLARNAGNTSTLLELTPAGQLKLPVTGSSGGILLNNMLLFHVSPDILQIERTPFDTAALVVSGTRTELTLQGNSASFPAGVTLNHENTINPDGPLSFSFEHAGTLKARMFYRTGARTLNFQTDNTVPLLFFTDDLIYPPSPNKERMRITPEGRIVVWRPDQGNVGGIETGEVRRAFQIIANHEVYSTIAAHNDIPDAKPGIIFLRSRGLASARADTADGDGLGEILVQGTQGTVKRNAAIIRFEQEGSAISAVPARIIFMTTPAVQNGVPLERMRITSGGTIAIWKANQGPFPTAIREEPGADSPLQLIGQGDLGTGVAAYGGRPALGFVHAGGTPSAPLDSADGDNLGAIQWTARSGGVFPPAAVIFAAQEGTGDATIVPSRLVFQVGKLGVGLEERMRLTSTGLSFFGVAAVARQAVTPLTDNTTGTATDAIGAAPTAYNAAAFNDIHASLLTKINQLRTALVNYGLLS